MPCSTAWTLARSKPIRNRRQAKARSYDFASQDRIIRGRMPTLEMVHERFARLWRIGLFNLIRRSAELSVRGIELIKFNDYMHSLYVPTNLNLIRFKPLRIPA